MLVENVKICTKIHAVAGSAEVTFLIPGWKSLMGPDCWVPYWLPLWFGIRKVILCVKILRQQSSKFSQDVLGDHWLTWVNVENSHG